ncbi:hypothetical protein Tco_0162586 [Tanacetum coccineum]
MDMDKSGAYNTNVMRIWLRAYVIDFGVEVGNIHLPWWLNFSYNNSYHSGHSLLILLRRLYAKLGSVMSPVLLKVLEITQKSYADNRRKPLELKVSPWKGVVRFGKKGKLAPRFVGPFEILERIGSVAYRLRLPEELSGVHDTFHVSNLKKCLADANLHVPLDEIKV